MPSALSIPRHAGAVMMRRRVKELFLPVWAHVKVPGRRAEQSLEAEHVPEFTGVVGPPGQAGYTSLPDH